jgi:hypothetical protein
MSGGELTQVPVELITPPDVRREAIARGAGRDGRLRLWRLFR